MAGMDAAKLVGKKTLGIFVFFLGLVIALGGYVASYALKSNILVVLGLAAGFILIVAGAELLGVE